MRKVLPKFAFLFLLAVSLSCATRGDVGPAPDVPLIPRVLLFGDPTYASPALSPDGARLAYLAPDEGVLNIWIAEADGTHARPLTHDRNRGIRGFRFAHDNRTVLYAQDRDGDENWHVFGVDIASGAVRDYTPFPNMRASMVGLDRERPSVALVQMNRRDARYFDLYELNLETGALTVVLENPGDLADWVLDPHLRLVGATRPTPDGGIDVLYRSGDSEPWRALLTWGPDDAGASEVVAATPDGAQLILRDSRNAPATRIVALDPDTGATHVLAEDAQYEAWAVVLHPETHAVQAAGVVRDRREWIVVDPAVRDDFTVLAEAARGDFQVISRDDADEQWIVAYTADVSPATYYVYERATRTLTHLFDSMPALAQYTFADMRPIAFHARDGLTIHGYLTLPPGAADRPFPLVLQVHGGPWSRYVWGFDPGMQWLANRGYAVLSVNFRGSTGYGKDFLNAGDREWGGAMHNDLIDAVRWAVDAGYADPDRVAISGGSYGGYGALVGLTFTPDVFACGVVVAGPTNLITLIDSVPPYWALYRHMLYRRLGDPATDAEFLRSRSPLFKADRIRAPVLLAYGANDPRVKQSEADQMVAALQANGVEYEYLLFPDEGHGFVKPENRLRFVAVAEAFLAKHLGGRYEPEN